jgi:hypothetical protein
MQNLGFQIQTDPILGVVQRFGKHCSCHPLGEYITVGRFRSSYAGQEVGGVLDVMELTGAAASSSAFGYKPC